MSQFDDLYEFLECAPKPWFVIVVGPPGSGKSTLAKEMVAKYGIKRFSTDDVIDRRARKLNVTYAQAFETASFGSIIQEMKIPIFQAGAMGESIFLDQTSMTKESRANKLFWASPKHTKICIDLYGLNVDQLDKRVQARVKAGGRHIPRRIIVDMLMKYEPPTVDEGFNLIYRLDQSE
jgi:predicted kinase